MATRPWVTPQEVKDYTEIKSVQSRTDARVAVDISRAEEYVISYTNNRFDTEEYTTIPAAVKTAVILLAEAYGFNSHISSKEVKSESFDDYSYTAADGLVEAKDLDLATLLDGYCIAKAKNRVTMRMRRL